MKFIILLMIMAGVTNAQARTWDELQDIAEIEFIGETSIRAFGMKGYRMDTPVREVILREERNPFAVLAHGLTGTISRGDQDKVVITLVSESGLSELSCYYGVNDSNYRAGEINTNLTSCKLTVFDDN